MAKINYQIPIGGLEQVRDKIVSILSVELAMQKQIASENLEDERNALIYNSIPDRVWLERTSTFNQGEVSFINVCVQENPIQEIGDNRFLDIGSSTGDQTNFHVPFVIFIGSGNSRNSRDVVNREAEAALSAHCLINLIRHIFMNPVYTLLDMQDIVVRRQVVNAIFNIPKDVTASSLGKRVSAVMLMVGIAEESEDSSDYPIVNESLSYVGATGEQEGLRPTKGYFNLSGVNNFVIEERAILYVRIEKVSGIGGVTVSGNGQLFSDEIGYRRITTWAKQMNINVTTTGNLVVNVIFELWNYKNIGYSRNEYGKYKWIN